MTARRWGEIAKMAAREKRYCWQCKQPVKVKDVGQERSKYPGQVQEYLCKTCQRENVEGAIRENREAKGWQT